MRGVAPRTRRAGALLLLGILLLPGLSGCLVARVPDLFGGADPALGPKKAAPKTNATEPFRLEGIVWAKGDTWVWDGSDGVRVTDKVVDVRRVQKIVGGRVLNVTRYDVETKEEWGDLLPLFSNHTYEPELGVVNSSAPGENATYFRGGAEFRNVPLTYIGPTAFVTTVEIHRFGKVTRLERPSNITLLGNKLVDGRAGQFTAWNVRVNTTIGYDVALQPISAVALRWFNESVKNDIRFTRGGVTFELVDYRVNNDTRRMELQRPPSIPAGWGVGWSWRYAGPAGVSLTRTVMPCDPPDALSFYPLCRKQLVYEGGTDLYELRSIFEHSRNGSSITLRDVALVDSGTFAPRAVGYYSVGKVQGWPAPSSVNYTGNVPPLTLPAREGQSVYGVRGTHVSGLPLDHTAYAQIALEPDLVSTPLGRIPGTRVESNITFRPNSLDPQYATFTEEHDRTWSPSVRQDVRFEQRLGGTVYDFVLQSVSFGESRKWERDI